MYKQGKYYDGTKLLSLLDVNNKIPEIYMCTSNRSGGKTTFFGRLLVNKFIKNKEKFGLIYRFNYELSDVAQKFFKELNSLFFQEYEMTYESKGNGKYCELYLNGESCGYAFALNDADQIKRLSHFFSDVSYLLFDEFQSETNHYCPNEITKFISIHQSIARGGGKQSRRVPVYMLSNQVTILNPYYAEFNIGSRLNNEVKFLKGDGWVLEQGYVENASRELNESAFNRAFSSNKYIGYSTGEGVYLNDSTNFVENMNGKSTYLMTLKYNGSFYAIREYTSKGIIYCDENPDLTHWNRISVTTDDHQINYVMLNRQNFQLQELRKLFELGCFRFKNIKCKEVVIKALSYK